jgi:anti-anti-sigma factor
VSTSLQNSAASSADFAVSVSFGADLAVIRPTGEVDYLSSPDLGAVLEAVIQANHRSVVLDLRDVGFLDAAGLGVIAFGAGHLAISGGTLTIRAPSAIVVRMLDITGLSAVVCVEPRDPGTQQLGSEETVSLPGAAEQPDDLLTRPLREVTSIPADDDVVDGALHLVVTLARATVGGADGVSVSLRRRGRLSTVASSDQTILDMDHDQYATGEGPCVDASVEGRWFHVHSLNTETRWPKFTPRARELGIQAILSSPLLAATVPVGALNIYSRTESAFTREDQVLAAMFATEASLILTNAGAYVTDDALAERLHQALRGRQLIAEAQGVLMSRDGMSEEEAFAMLRESSTSAHLTLRARAEEILASIRQRQPVAAPEPGDRHQ